MRLFGHFILQAVLTVSVLLAGIQFVHAQDTGNDGASDDIEINLDALDVLPPARDESRPDPATVGTEPVLIPPPLPEEAPAEPAPVVNDQAPPPLEDTAAAPTTTNAPDLPGAPSAEDPLAASATPDATAGNADAFAVTLLFGAGNDTLDLTASQQLDSFANRLRSVPGRITLYSFAGTDSDPPSLNGRKALKRAIVLRGYLMDRGIPGSRIDLRPQGAAKKGTAAERVDLTFTPQ